MEKSKDVKELENSSKKIIREDASAGVNDCVHSSIHEKPLFDPIDVRTKGSRSSNFKSQLEKSQNKKIKEKKSKESR